MAIELTSLRVLVLLVLAYSFRWEHPFIWLGAKLTIILAAIVAYFFVLASKK
jgi:hypothetical protein